MCQATPFLAPLLFLPLLSAQVANETGRSTDSRFPDLWPDPPSRASVPEWAKPGRIRFSRWDGGPVETAKAFLSGWPGFNPSIPDHIAAMTDWYDFRTIRLLREAGINTIWVTFSVGFSIPTERRQMELLTRYADECHRQGIRVIAYQSVANMFWEDMFEHVPESRDWVAMSPDGKPVPYGAGDYTKMGRVTRYMAKLAHPGWREYLRKRIDLAIDAGMDGIFYDNNPAQDLVSTYQEIYRYASSRKRDILILPNFHRADYVCNRLTNAIFSEDGAEPGIYRESQIAGGIFKGWLSKSAREALPPLEGGYLINSFGHYRMLNALMEGWRPSTIMIDPTEVPDRLMVPMPGPRHQLALAECAAHGVALSLFVEGGFMRGLWQNEPETMAIWRAIGAYNRFLADHEDLYVDAWPAASLAVVLDDRSDGLPLLDGLAARGVSFHVLYDYGLTAGRLRPYTGLLVAGNLRPKARQAVATWGGKAVEAGEFSTVAEMAQALKALERPGGVRVEAPPGMLYSVNEQREKQRLVVHLLNYTSRPMQEIRIRVPGSYSKARLLTPDEERAPLRVEKSAGADRQVVVPALKIYSVVVLAKGADE